ncbi:MAG: hypothetical protein Ct9H300mP25_14700 [Acidobacteriota bacterium]|nr:MAG: hypothetical protein Ct9H300mP25_14700 [Acidobacteriota bacterium]
MLGPGKTLLVLTRCGGAFVGSEAIGDRMGDNP